MRRLTYMVISSLGIVLLAGCEATPPDIPVSLPQFETMQKNSPGAYPEHVVFMHNLLRVCDRQLPPAQRVDSLRLIDRLSRQDPQAQAELSEVLTDPTTPAELQSALVEMLMAKEDPVWAGEFVALATRLPADSALRGRILVWMAKHPGPAVLGEVVKAWASRAPTDPAEKQFTQLVGQMTGKPWDKALLEAMESPDFNGGPWALEVLGARKSPEALRQELAALPAQSQTVRALRAFATRFDYLPANATEFRATLAVYSADMESVERASRLFRQWQGQGYAFNIRDFHLLAELAGDATCQAVTRAQLVAGLEKAVGAHEHVHCKPRGDSRVDDRFEADAARLTMADLWNMRLFEEMLARARIQAALRVVAQQDRADTRTAWGGLVFLRSGEADAMLYQPAIDAPDDDLTYAPSVKALADGQMALARFVAHFEKESNADRAGPTAEELRAAAEDNCCGLIFTSVRAEAFCAHYYNPRGIVVSLGVFPFQVWK